tara:strand:+ start:501 stop:1634 length:1134 start_codon:yes stop_codon:yes gene_type:complete
MKKVLLLGLGTLFCLIASFSIAADNPLTEEIGWVTKLEGPLTNSSGSELTELIDEANDEGVSFVLIQIDTPGGRVDALRELVKTILNSNVPIISYVGPQGARSASAGTYLVLSSHIAAMAPATNIGSSTPVTIGGPAPSEDMRNKMVNDAAAYIRGLAAQRGRNAEWAEKSVRDSVNITSKEALDLNVIDFIAPSIPELLKQIDGVTITLQNTELAFSPGNAKLVDKSVSGNISYSIVWIVSGAAMILAEFLFSGFIVVFFGLGAVIAGIAVAFGVPGSGGIPFIIFSVSSIVLLVVARNHMKTWFQGDLVGEKNADIDTGIIGDSVEIVSGFDESSPGYGIVRYRGSNWNARSEKEIHQVGTRLQVVDRESNVLIV